ncbi:MAG: hypothetical protein ACRDM1_01720 [Gaiellaceae bacterium]
MADAAGTDGAGTAGGIAPEIDGITGTCEAPAGAPGSSDVLVGAGSEDGAGAPDAAATIAVGSGSCGPPSSASAAGTTVPTTAQARSRTQMQWTKREVSTTIYEDMYPVVSASIQKIDCKEICIYRRSA